MAQEGFLRNAADVQQAQLDKRLASAINAQALMAESGENSPPEVLNDRLSRANSVSSNSSAMVTSGSESLTQSLIKTLKRTSSSMNSSAGDESPTTSPPDDSVFNKQKLEEYTVMSKSTPHQANITEEQIKSKKTDLMVSITKKNDEVVSALKREFGSGETSKQIFSNILALSSKKETDDSEPQAVRRPIVASSSSTKNVGETEKSKLKGQLDKIAATIDIEIGGATIKLSELNNSLLKSDGSTTPPAFITQEVATSILDSLRKTNPPQK